MLRSLLSHFVNPRPLAILFIAFMAGTVMATEPFFIGTYTGGASKGIYRSALNENDGSLEPPVLVAELTNPSFLTIHPALSVLYAVSEVGKADAPNRQLVAYKIGDDFSLSEIGAIGLDADAPCYVATNPSGTFVFVANYGSGNIAAIALNSDGSLGQIVSRVQHTGSSINPSRQQGPHAHCILTDPSEQFVCAVDLGLDKVLVYRQDAQTGKLLPTDSPLNVEAGNGPRHLAFHPSGKLAFVIHELSSKLSSYRWDETAGTFTEIATVSTLPDAFDGKNSTAEVLVHPNGKFVFGSNRGHDSIATFRIDDSGKLESLGHTPSGGKTPRNFRIDPTGNFLLAENQQSDSIHSSRIDLNTGKLSPVSSPISVGSPCCIKFYKR